MAMFLMKTALPCVMVCPRDVRFTPQKRTFGAAVEMSAKKVMFALPLKRDMCGALAYVRFVPIADMTRSTDHSKQPQPCG
jgi:hypothetical protein